MLITKKMHEARVKAIREAVKSEKDNYIFRTEMSWYDGDGQECCSCIVYDLDGVAEYINKLRDVVDEIDILIDLDEFEKNDSKKVRGFTPIYTAKGTEAESGKTVYRAGYLRKIEKNRK